MRVNRRLLYPGLFLASIGAVLLAADLSAVDTPILADALRLWPLVVVAIGTAIVLRRTQFSLPSGMLAAAVPGIVLGSALAVAPRYAGDCGARGDPASVATEGGTFSGTATVSVTSGCGSLTVRTAPGSEWQLQAGNTAGRTPIVRSARDSLSIRGEGIHFMGGSREALDLTLPTSQIQILSLATFASNAHVELPGAQIERLVVSGNASRIVVDASTAAIENVSAVVNTGSLAILVPADRDLAASVRLGGGELLVCAPSSVGLRVITTGFGTDTNAEGVEHAGSTWQSPNYESASHHADLQVRASVATVEINPIGGCK